MKKIAIITNTNFGNRKGEANAALNRIKYLKQIADYDIDVYNLSFYEGLLMRLLRKTKRYKRVESINIDGICIKYIWKKFSLFSFILETKLGFKRIFENNKYNDIIHTFKYYNAISAHSSECGKLALLIKEKFGIPYYVTWHGSDIHTCPFNNKYVKKETTEILENALNNFFVSNALLRTSNKITVKAEKQLLYNGVGSEFVRYNNEKRELLRTNYGVSGKKVVAFIGNLFPIKNVLFLPEIFKNIKDNYDKDIVFWIIGDGKLKSELEQLLNTNKVECKLWGNQPSHIIPDFMNAIDVLILPSKNEGLPLVTIEALACGANVVGSNVGGISESIGKDNSFDLDDNFVKNISNRIIEMLVNEIEQPLSDKFNWCKTAKIENEIYLKELNK